MYFGKKIGTMLKHLVNNNKEKFIKSFQSNKIPFDTVCIYKDEEHSQMDLWFDWKKYKKDQKWDLIQRDILMDLTKEFVTILHMIDEEITPEDITSQFDDKIGNIYPLYRKEGGECFIEIMPQDYYLLSELQSQSLLWECGYILHIATFKERNEKGLKGNFEDAKFILSDFVDNDGFIIDVKDMKQYGGWIENIIQEVCDKYEVKLEYKTIDNIG